MHFTGHDAGKLPCPVMIIPGSLSEERFEELGDIQSKGMALAFHRAM